MSQINIAAAGNASESINLINPRFQAEALRMLRGRDVGVLDNTFYSKATNPKGTSRTANSSYMWPLTFNGLEVTIGRGMATAFGYDIQSESSVTFTLTAPASGYKWVFIYLEWDLHNPDQAVGSIKMWDNGSSTSWTPPSQDNLITNPIGTYQMPLYRIAVYSGGNITSYISWSSLGIDTIGYPLRSLYANRAEEADHADAATSATSATNATNATNAEYCKGYQSYGKIHDRLVNIVTRLNEMGFKQGTLSLNTGVGAIYKLGNFVIGYLSFVASVKNIGTVPAGFRPYSSLTFKNLAIRDYISSSRVYEYKPLDVTFGSDGSITGSTKYNVTDVAKTIYFGWDVTNRDYDVDEFVEGSSGSSSGSSSGGCVTRDTEILVDLSGRAMRADEIRKNDAIIGMTLTGPRLFKVRAVYILKDVKNVYKVSLSDGTSVKITPNHPVLTPEGYKAINNDLYPVLAINDTVLKYNKNVTVTSIEVIDYNDTVYNFLTELDNYIADGVVVATEDSSTGGEYSEPDGALVK